jgi:hypothetical protein
MLNWALGHEDVTGSGGISPPILAPDGGERSASHARRFTAGESAPDTHCRGG